MGLNPYYSDGLITLYHGDCREVLPTLDVTGLVVSDPPYGINLNNDWQNEIHAEQGRATNNAKGGIVGDDGLTDWAEVLEPFKRRVVFGFPYLFDADATGWLVWDKEPGFKGKSLTSPVEMAYATTWKGFKIIRLLWSGYMRAPGAEARTEHPTQKSESLIAQIIQWHDDELILDPFSGSGTTLVSARQLGRKAIGIELEERFCEITANRLSPRLTIRNGGVIDDLLRSVYHFC
jgi:site-specific DNA-methyltransferase (adenine-specific)